MLIYVLYVLGRDLTRKKYHDCNCNINVKCF